MVQHDNSKYPMTGLYIEQLPGQIYTCNIIFSSARSFCKMSHRLMCCILPISVLVLEDFQSTCSGKRNGMLKDLGSL